MIATRYVVRDIFHTQLLILAVLLLLLVTNMFIHYLGVAATGAMVGSEVIKLIGMTLPRYLATLIPVAFYLAIVFACGKLFQTNELTILFSCGLSWRDVLKMLWLPGLFLMCVVGAVTLVIMPKMSAHLSQLTANAAKKSNLQFVQPGRFMSLGRNNQVVYIGHSNFEKLTVRDLFLYRKQSNTGQAQIIVAPLGYQTINPKTKLTYVVLKHGSVYLIPKNSDAYQMIHFNQYAVQLKVPHIRSEGGVSSASTLSLISQKSTLEDAAEFQWRLALPISVIVLMLLGLAVCYVGPRQSRYIKVIPAVLLFVVYFNLLSISKTWIVQGLISPYIGLWWVHIVFAGGSLMWILKRDGVKIFNKLKNRGL